MLHFYRFDWFFCRPLLLLCKRKFQKIKIYFAKKKECIHFIMVRYFVSCSFRQYSDMQLVVRIHDVRVNDSLDQICKMVSNYPNG